MTVPVIKDRHGCSESYDNYRPLSLVDMFSKLLELCISPRLVKLLHVHELQYGFVAGKGCQKALFTLESIVIFLLLAAVQCLRLLLTPQRPLFHKLICQGNIAICCIF